MVVLAQVRHCGIYFLKILILLNSLFGADGFETAAFMGQVCLKRDWRLGSEKERAVGAWRSEMVVL